MTCTTTHPKYLLQSVASELELIVQVTTSELLLLELEQACNSRAATNSPTRARIERDPSQGTNLNCICVFSPEPKIAARFSKPSIQ